MEILDLYNARREKTGKTAVRGEKIEEGSYHFVIHVCIFASDGRMLIQQRQKDKHGWPNMWDISVGGSAVSGEDPQDAASRELFEELGIKYDFTGIRPHLTVNFDVGFDDYFIIEKDVDLNETVLQPEEVQAVKWATRDEIRQMMADGIFIPYHPSLIELLFESVDHYGAMER
ncbi:MAG: NUDIX domain-containing protein [Clostridia bacterium]|nr:NUDIX domain-containing protein [Clostridia bacterium]